MVGVPGRSKGCNTCIQRKVKCDQQTPYCGTCKKSKRLCTGYQRRLGYVFSNALPLPSAGGSDATEDPFAHQGRWRKSTASRRQPPALSRITRPAAQQPPPSLAWMASLMALWLPRPVAAGRVMREQFHAVLLGMYLPARVLDVPDSDPIAMRSWLLQLHGLDIQSPALEEALTAFCVAQVARSNDDTALLHRSRQSYLSSLRYLQNDLARPKTRFSDETLASCLVLSLYELAIPCGEGVKAWQSHIEGAMVLLKLRGPDATTSMLGHCILQELRAHALLKSLMFHQETFLAQPKWLTQPWTLLPKTPGDEITDQLLHMSVLLRESDIAHDQKDLTIKSEAYCAVAGKYAVVERRLLELHENFQGTVSGPLYWPKLSQIESPFDDEASGKVFPVAFHFPEPSVAQVVVSYFSAMMTVHVHLLHIYRHLRPLQRSCADAGASGSDELAELYEKHDGKWRDFSKKICQSAEYFLQEGMGSYGQLLVMTYLSGCYSCYIGTSRGADSREIDWILDMILRIKKKLRLPDANLLTGAARAMGADCVAKSKPESTTLK